MSVPLPPTERRRKGKLFVFFGLALIGLAVGGFALLSVLGRLDLLPTKSRLGGAGYGGDLVPATRGGIPAPAVLPYGRVGSDEAFPVPYPVPQGDLAERSKPRVVRNANFSLVVKSAGEAVERLEGLAQRFGGFVQSSSLWEVRPGVRNGSLTIRLPEKHFTPALAEVRRLGLSVESEQVSGQDVTAQYIDLKARLKVAEAEEAQYLDILKRADKIPDVLQVTHQLSAVRSRIESLKGQIQLLENQSDFSTINVNLREDVPLPAIIQKWRPLRQVVKAWQALLATLKGLVNVLIWLAVYIMPLALVVFAVWRLIRALRRRRGQVQTV